MAKQKVIYYCQNCGAQSSSWLGKCPQCGSWNSFVEEIVKHDTDSGSQWSKTSKATQQSKPKLIKEITYSEEERIATSCAEFDRVLGGGLVKGSLVLIGGEPGIGKSTLLLQVALLIKNQRVLYVSGEESEQQIRMRAERIHKDNDTCYIVSETSTQQIFQHIETVKPDIVVVDSIQTISTDSIESSAGSISQIRECTAEFQRFAKTTGVPVILIGHITKDGSLAGPKIMEHIVDCVLQFEGDRNYGYRILRSMKNRFGSTSELGIFEMQSSGLREVSNPSEILLSQHDPDLSGTAISATLEGMRPMLIEVQALVSSAVYGTPQRSATGFDLRRLSMLLAVLEKRCGFKLGAKDVFLNIAGGIKVYDPAIDLAVVTSVLSSNLDMPLSQKDCFAAEIGLSGEVRPINRVEQRISEAQKIGFERIFISKYNAKGIDKTKYNIEIVECATIENVFRKLFS